MSIPALKLYHKESYPAISPSLPSLSQAGKTVIVSGGNSGIGLAISRAFVAAGAKRVIILGRRAEVTAAVADTLNKEAGRQAAEGRAVDAYSLQGIDELWNTLQTEGIYVDVLVLSAATYGKQSPILESSLDETWQDFEANARSPLAMTIRFHKQTTGSGKKYLVNISTIAAYMWTTMAPDRPTYGLTKGAGTALLQQIAKDTSADDLQIVSFHPGGVLTDSARKHGEGIDFSKIKLDHEDLPGHFSVWAASPEATFLHGRFVWANWDVEELKNGVVAKQIQEDEHFLKVGIEGLSEKNGGVRF